MVTKKQTTLAEEEPTEKNLSALVLSGYTFIIGVTKSGDVAFRTNEEGLEVYMSTTEALMLSLALQQAVEDLDSDH